VISTTLCGVTGDHDLRDAQATRAASSATATDRYRTIVDVYVLLRRPDGKILLLERAGTGYADGQLCPTGVRAGSSAVTC